MEMTDTEFGLTRKGEAVALQPYLNPLPRSVVRRNAFELLDGEWRFALDPENHGLAERWYLGHDYTGTAHWPGTIEAQIAAGHVVQQENPVGGNGDVVAWYEREFEVPAEWVAARESEVQITFGACGYETRVWLNGVPLRTVEGAEAHVGEYTSFSFELPREHLTPVNRLTVRVADSLDPDMPRGKQESHVYKRGGIWYQTISGPVRSVWIEPVERNRLRSRLGVVSTIEERLVEFQVTTRVHDPGRYVLRLVVSERGADKPLASLEIALALEPGEARQYLTLQMPNAELWSPTSPTLYQLVAQLSCPNGHVSQIESLFGLRTVEAHGRSFRLNGERIYLDGILYQPTTSTFEEIRRHMLGMRQLGCNLVRVHIAGIDPRVYELADEMGMLLWVEVPSPHQPTAVSRANHWDELQRLLVQIAEHPSIVIVSLYNEDWGAEDIATNGETREYITRAYAHLRLHYPQFLVVDNDGWQHVSVEGRLKSDLLTVHSYYTDVDRWREVLDDLVAGKHHGVAARPLVVGDPFCFVGQVPLLVSEWGGFGFSWYGGPKDLDVRADRIREFKREVARRPIAGDVYTQAVSVEGETNGLLDPQTGELLVPAGLLSSAESQGTHREPNLSL